jgi:hypothetical protein
MVLITIVNGVYKPTYNWGASHCIDIYTQLYTIDAIAPTRCDSDKYRHVNSAYMQIRLER